MQNVKWLGFTLPTNRLTSWQRQLEATRRIRLWLPFMARITQLETAMASAGLVTLATWRQRCRGQCSIRWNDKHTSMHRIPKTRDTEFQNQGQEVQRLLVLDSIQLINIASQHLHWYWKWCNRLLCSNFILQRSVVVTNGPCSRI